MEQLLDELGDGADKVLAIVYHDEGLAVADHFCHHLGYGTTGQGPHAKGLGHGKRYRRWVGKRGEGDEVGTFGEAACHRRGHFLSQPGLPAAARTGQGDQAALPDQPGHFGHFFDPADEAAGRVGQGAGEGHGRRAVGRLGRQWALVELGRLQQHLLF